MLPRAVLANISLFSHIFYTSKGAWNKLENMKNSENISGVTIWPRAMATTYHVDI